MSQTSTHKQPAAGHEPKSQAIPFTVMLMAFIASLRYLHKTLYGLASLLLLRERQHRSIGQLLDRQSRRFPDKTAILYHDTRYSYAEFNSQANRYAQYFRSCGIGQGDVVAIAMDNRPESLFAVMGAVKLGSIAAMINTSQRESVLLHSFNLVKPKLVIVGTELAAAVLAIEAELLPLSSLPIHCCVDPEGTDVVPGQWVDIGARISACTDDSPAETAMLTLGLPCFYIFTSGTTGLPKASIMTHLRWFKSLYGVAITSMKLRHDDIFYVVLPFYHNNALTVSLSGIIGVGATLAIGRKFSASQFWDEVRHYRATCFSYIGELCRYLVNQPERRDDADNPVRVIIGNGLRPDIWDEFQHRFAIRHINEFYGASECNLLFTNSYNLKYTAGFCPLPYAVVQFDQSTETPLRSAQGFMSKVKKGQTGLLITKVSERFPFEGYTNKEANEGKLLFDVFKPGDCYFNSGDLVLHQGFRHIAFVDRVGDTFRWKGENVASTEVEGIANQFPGVKQAVVYGVTIPNTDGRAGMIALTLALTPAEFDFAAFHHFIKASLPAYAIPVFLRIAQQYDVTGTFKVKKLDLKKEAYGPNHSADPVYVSLPDSDTYQLLDEALRDAINCGKFKF